MVRIRTVEVFALLLCLSALVSCDRKPMPGALPEPPSRGVAPEVAVKEDVPTATSEQTTEDMTTLVARVNGEGIPVEEFEQLYHHVLSQHGNQMTTDEKFNLRVNMLNNLIMARIIKQKALEADLPVDATAVDMALDQIRQNFHFNEREFLNSLQTQGMNLEQFRKTVENELKVEKFREMISSQYDVRFTEEDLKDWYEENKDSYKSPEMVRVSHILISLPLEAGEEQIQEAYSRAVWIREQIVNLGADFGSMAEKYSEDIDSATEGGLLGDMYRGMMVMPFEDAAFALPVGGISPPVRTYKGWHLIKVNARIPSRQLTFEQAHQAGMLERDYEAHRRLLHFTDWLRNQRTQTTVEILDPNIAVVR